MNEKENIIKNNEALSSAETNKLQEIIKNLEKELKNKELKYNELLTEKEGIHIQHLQSIKALKNYLDERREFNLDSNAEESIKKRKGCKMSLVSHIKITTIFLKGIKEIMKKRLN